MTVDQVKDAVRVNKDVIATEIAKIEAEAVERILKGICDSIRDKSSNLITLSTLTRDEIKAKLAVEMEHRYEPNAQAEGTAARLRERLAS